MNDKSYEVDKMLETLIDMAKDEVDKAKSHATDFYENAIYEATMKGIWQSAAWWLERRRREVYNKPDKILVNPKQDLSEFVEDKKKQDEILDDL